MSNILICGAYDHTGNLGVSALGNAFAAAWHQAHPDDVIYLQALDGSLREIEYTGFNSRRFKLTSVSLRPSKKFTKPDSFLGMKISGLFGLSNKFKDILDSIDIFFDVAGGDSFTDLYGLQRFRLVNSIKEEAIKRGKPLVLLPQTYGPFIAEESKKVAEKYVRYATFSMARDEYSFDILKELLGAGFDASRHQCGVDMAFLLPVSDSTDKLSPQVRDWIKNGKQFLGINVSGLIYNQPEEAKSRYSFVADYNQVVYEFVLWILESTDENVVIVPHVLVGEDSVESDYRASLQLVERLPEQYKKRVSVQSPTLDQCEVKKLISMCTWFMGTRMHATIAGLSTQVPTATISYSDKALGVFKSCGVESAVIDPRSTGTEDVLAKLKGLYHGRSELAVTLNKSIPEVKAVALAQIDEMSKRL